MLQLHPLDDSDLGVEATAATPRRGGGLTVREMEKDDEVVFFSDDIDEVKAYAAPYGQSYFSDEMVSLVEDGEVLTIEEVRPSASWGGDSEAVGAVVINGWSFLPGLFMRAGGELSPKDARLAAALRANVSTSARRPRAVRSLRDHDGRGPRRAAGCASSCRKHQTTVPTICASTAAALGPAITVASSTTCDQRGHLVIASFKGANGYQLRLELIVKCFYPLVIDAAKGPLKWSFSRIPGITEFSG